MLLFMQYALGTVVLLLSLSNAMMQMAHGSYHSVISCWMDQQYAINHDE